MISVIVPVYNGGTVIASCLDALVNQNFPKKQYEVIVVDDGSKDNTVSVVSEFKTVKLVRQGHKGPAAARNHGVSKSKGELVLFTDSDCVPPKNWIKKITKPFKNREVAGVGGTYRTLNKKSLVARFVGYEIEERHKTLGKNTSTDFIGTFSAAYRKQIFTKFGGFDKSFPAASGEDPELSFRISKAGHKLVFEPNAFVYHKHPETLGRFLKQKFWRGFWRAFTYSKHKDKVFRHSYTPKSLLLEELLLGVTTFLSILGAVNLVQPLYPIAVFLLTFCLAIPFSIRTFRKDRTVGLLSPVIILLRNFSSGLGAFFGILNILYEKTK